MWIEETERTEFSIGELAREFDVTPRAIRFYEAEGLISPRRDGQRRIYTPRDRTRLKLTLRGKRLGLAMALIGASLTVVESGRVEIELPFRDEITQQKGYVHGGIIGMIADNACGYSAYSLMPASASLVTVEYKINILAPARGSLVARGEVVKAGRTRTVARARV